MCQLFISNCHTSHRPTALSRGVKFQYKVCVCVTISNVRCHLIQQHQSHSTFAESSIGRIFGTSKKYFSGTKCPKCLWLLSFLRRWFCCCWFVVDCYSHCILCFVVCYFVSILILQSFRWGRQSWLLCFVCLPNVSWLLCGSTSRCTGLSAVCDWLLYFLIILTFFMVLYLHSVLFSRLIGLSPLSENIGYRNDNNPRGFSIN